MFVGWQKHGPAVGGEVSEGGGSDLVPNAPINASMNFERPALQSRALARKSRVYSGRGFEAFGRLTSGVRRPQSASGSTLSVSSA